MSDNEKNLNNKMDANDEEEKRDSTVDIKEGEVENKNDLTDEDESQEINRNVANVALYFLLQNIGPLANDHDENEETSKAVMNFIKDFLFSFLIEMNYIESKVK